MSCRGLDDSSDKSGQCWPGDLKIYCCLAEFLGGVCGMSDVVSIK